MSPNVEAMIGNRTRRRQEFMLALLMLALGIQLTFVPDEVFKAGGALEPLMLLKPAFWSLSFTILGTARLIIVIINGVWRPSPTVRMWMSGFGIWIWLSITYGYWRMFPATAGFPALVFAPVVAFVEANCLIALSALRAGRRNGT